MTYGNVSLGTVEIHKQNNHKASIRACGLTTGSTGSVLITFHLPKVNTLHSILLIMLWTSDKSLKAKVLCDSCSWKVIFHRQISARFFTWEKWRFTLKEQFCRRILNTWSHTIIYFSLKISESPYNSSYTLKWGYIFTIEPCGDTIPIKPSFYVLFSISMALSNLHFSDALWDSLDEACYWKLKIVS